MCIRCGLYIFMNTFSIFKTQLQAREARLTLWTPTDDGHADLTSHDTFTAGPPHATFARLRREDPMHWTEYAAGQSFWSVTRTPTFLS